MPSLRERIERHPGLGEAIGLALLLLAVLSTASLLSYDAADPSYGFHSRPGSGETANWMGRVGATLAEALLQLFGTAAFLFPVGAGYIGWRRLRREELRSGWQSSLAAAALALSLTARS